MNITIQYKNLKAVSYAMGVKDIRQYINGVLVEFNGQQGRLVATDGCRMHAVQFDATGELMELFTAIMPAAFVATLLKQKKVKTFELIFTAPQFGGFGCEPGTVSCQLNGMITVAKLVEGKFPDYMRTIPSYVSGETACFDPAYLADLNAAMNAYREYKIGHYEIQHNGKGAGLFTGGGFVAVIMSLRGIESGDGDSTRPDWKQALPSLCVRSNHEINHNAQQQVAA